MNLAVCIMTWREFRSNRIRLILLVLLFLAPFIHLLAARFGDGAARDQDLLNSPYIACAYALLWGIGVIGREVQHGTISLVLARPISIITYVISKWLAVSIAASVCSFQAVLCEHLLSSSYVPHLLLQPDFLVNAAQRILMCLGLSAFLVFLSSLVSGIKDMALLAGILLFLGILQAVPGVMNAVCQHADTYALIEPVKHIVNLISRMTIFCLIPFVPLPEIIGGFYHDLVSVVYLLALITCCLSLSIFVLTHREFSYAAE